MPHHRFLAPLTLSLMLLAPQIYAADRTTQELILPITDGYGMDDCLAEAGTCGQMIADAWCKANGLARSIAYGPIDPAEMTASISAAKVTSRAPLAYSITCEAPQP